MEENSYVSKLSQMINVETINNGKESDLEKFSNYQNLLAELFPNLFATFAKEVFHGSLLLYYVVDSKEKPICLMSHQDVVEPNGKWDSDPFKAAIRDNKLFGRGTLDTKGNFFAFAQALEELLEEKYQFTRSIYIISTCNEETNGQGMYEITDYLIKKDIHFDFVLDEGGMIVDNMFGSKDTQTAMIALGEKQCVDIKFSVTKSGGHASTPEKKTSLTVLSEFMNKVNKFNGFIKYLEPTNRDLLTLISPTCRGVKKFIFKHPNFFSFLIKKLFNVISAATKAMISSTICFTQIEGSKAVNVIPETSYVMANVRVSHKEGYERCLKKLKKIADKYGVEMEVTDQGYASKISSFKTSQFNYLKKTIERCFSNTIALPYISNSATDSKCADKICENIFRFSPFKISNSQLESIHGINENVDIEALNPAVNFYKKLIRGLNYGK